MSNTYIELNSMLDRHILLCNNVSMELRELKYFLAVAREESISKAAEALFITQPSLSRQMQNLEKETGKVLFVRGSRKITLTEAGMLLKKRAEEIVELCDKAQREVASFETVSGEIYIGGGESYALGIVANASKKMIENYPDVRFNFHSADTVHVMEMLNKGLIDFGVLVLPADLSGYDYITLPDKDTWGVLMRKDSALADKQFVTAEDLKQLPLIRSRHTLSENEVADWFSKNNNSYNIVATYNLIYNASLLVKEGVGYAVGLDRLINTSGNSDLTFRPLYPPLQTSLVFAWKRYRIFSKSASKFLEVLRSCISDDKCGKCDVTSVDDVD